jgi:hypothetical protein
MTAEPVANQGGGTCDSPELIKVGNASPTPIPESRIPGSMVVRYEVSTSTDRVHQ